MTVDPTQVIIVATSGISTVATIAALKVHVTYIKERLAAHEALLQTHSRVIARVRLEHDN